MEEYTSLQEVTLKAENKDKRWSKQFGDFAELLVMHVLGQGKNMSVALVDHVGADIFAVDRTDHAKRFAISVKGRIVPNRESRNYTFDRKNIQALEETANMFGMTPAVALVFVDEQEGKRKIRLLFATLSNIDKLARDQEATFVDYHTKDDGYVFRWTEGKTRRYVSEHFRGRGYDRWKHFIDYTELSFDFLERQLGF